MHATYPLMDIDKEQATEWYTQIDSSRNATCPELRISVLANRCTLQIVDTHTQGLSELWLRVCNGE